MDLKVRGQILQAMAQQSPYMRGIIVGRLDQAWPPAESGTSYEAKCCRAGVNQDEALLQTTGNQSICYWGNIS